MLLLVGCGNRATAGGHAKFLWFVKLLCCALWLGHISSLRMKFDREPPGGTSTPSGEWTLLGAGGCQRFEREIRQPCCG